MTWFKVDDGFWCHPKTLAISAEAVALWVRAGSYCGQQLTDGFLTDSARTLFGLTFDTAAEELVEAGLWEKRDGGYQFRNWDEYQPSRDDVETKRAADRERKRQAREVRKESARTSGRTRKRVSKESALPDPARPDQLTTPKGVGGASDETPTPTKKRATRITENWMPPQEVINTIEAEYPALDLAYEHSQFVDYWLGVSGQRGTKLDWDATWRKWMRKAGKEQADHQSRGYRTQNQIMADERARAAHQTNAMEGNALNLIAGGNQ